jgi:tRNA(Ile2) C34 agmatinyltransferase TiaS
VNLTDFFVLIGNRIDEASAKGDKAEVVRLMDRLVDELVEQRNKLSSVLDQRAVTNVKVTFTVKREPACAACGATMVPSGSCWKCLNCGETSGCS